MKRLLQFLMTMFLSFAMVGCYAEEKPVGPGLPEDTAEAELSVSPEIITTTLEGGVFELTILSNASWVISCDQRDVYFDTNSGAGNAVVTVIIPEVTAARNFSIQIEASKMAMMQGIPYTSTVQVGILVYQNADGDTSVATNVKEVRDLLLAMSPSSTATAVTDEIAAMTLTGVLVAEPNGNLSNNKSIVIQDDNDVAGSGLTIYCTGNVSDDLAIGDVVSISLYGAKVQVYAGLLQVSNIAPATIVVNGSTTVAPIDVTLDNALNYESQYVKLSDVYPASGVAGNVWNSTTSSTNVNFMTANGVSFVIRVSGYASFKGETIPEKMGSICGVVGQYNGTFQLMPQYASDIQLTEDIPVVDNMPATIADILSNGVGTYKVENAWVVATYTRGCLLTDASGAYILAYNPTTTPAVGTVVSIEGTVSAYNDVLQFGAGAEINPTSETMVVTHPTAEVLDGAAMDAYYAAPAVKYAEFSGVLAVSGNYYNVAVDGATVIGSISNPNTEIAEELKALNGATIKATGYMIGKSTSGGKNYANMMAVSVENLSGGDEPVAPDTPVVPDTPVDTTIISSVADLTAGTYYMAGMLATYTNTNNSQVFDWSEYPYHFWTGAVSALGSSTSNSDLTTVNGNASLVLDPNMSDLDKAKGSPALITLVAVDGKANTFYIKSGDKYLYSAVADTNRRMQLGDTPTEWIASNNDNGGIVLKSNGANLGTAGATYNLLRSYKDSSAGSSLKYGLVFFSTTSN